MDDVRATFALRNFIRGLENLENSINREDYDA
jgi:hypothetical protein